MSNYRKIKKKNLRMKFRKAFKIMGGRKNKAARHVIVFCFKTLFRFQNIIFNKSQIYNCFRFKLFVNK